MQKALETYIIDLMRNFNDFGILNQDGKPFEPHEFDFNNPEHFAKLKLFELGLDSEISQEMASDSGLPFYDPTRGTNNQKPEANAPLVVANDNSARNVRNAAPKIKWVDANQHEYPANAGKAMWNIALKSLTEFRELAEAHRGDKLGDKILSFRENGPKIQAFLQNHAKYLDGQIPTEPKARAKDLKSYTIPVVVDKRTLAFANSSKKFLTAVMALIPDPFKEVNDILEAYRQSCNFALRAILGPVLTFIKGRQEKSIVGFEVAQPELLERIKLYEARNEALNTLDAQFEEINRQIQNTQEFQLTQDYCIQLYDSDIATVIREEYETILNLVYMGKDVQQIIQAPPKLRAYFQKVKTSLIKIAEAKQNEKSNAFTLHKQLIEENQGLIATLREKQILQDTTTLELQNFNTLDGDVAAETIAQLEPRLRAAQKKLQDNEGLLSSVSSTLSNGVSVAFSYGAYWLSSSAPASESQTAKEPSPEEPKSEIERLQPEIQSARDTQTKIKAGRASIEQRLATLKKEIPELENKIAANKSAIATYKHAIDQKIAEIEGQARACISKLDKAINDQLLAIQKKSRSIGIAEFEKNTLEYFETLRSIYEEYNLLKECNKDLWSSQKLSESQKEFEKKWANYPLANSDIKNAIMLLSADYHSFNLSSRFKRWKQRKKAEKFALAFLQLIDSFTTSKTPQGKIDALVRFKNICEKLTLPRNTSVAVGIILGVLIAIVVAGLLISGWGIFFAAGATAILTATLITKIAAGSVLYMLGILGMSIGWAAGDSATPAITENYQKLGENCTRAYQTLEDLAKSLAAKSKSLEPESKSPFSVEPKTGDSFNNSGEELVEFLPDGFEEAVVVK